MRKILAGIVLLGASQLSFAEEAELTIDQYYSPYTGANLLITGLRGYQTLDDILISGTVGDTSTCMSFARIGKWLVEYSLSSWAMVTQHEYFGHGFQARSFNAEYVAYSIKPFHGKTLVTTNGTLHAQQRAALAAGGMNATSVLAGQLEKSFMQDGLIDRRAATMYLVNSLDQFAYAFGTVSNDFRADNDFVNYINQVNAWQGPNVLKRGTLRQKIAWDLLDPMLYFSTYSIFRYLWHGDSNVNFDFLHVGDARFMPSTRTLLSPWGPELQLKAHFFTPENKYIGVFVRSGRTGGVNSHGIDVQISPFKTYGDLNIGTRISVWKQPHLLENISADANYDKFGFAGFLDASYRFNDIASATGGMGYKTSGFVPGLQLRHTFLWFVGMKFNLS